MGSGPEILSNADRRMQALIASLAGERPRLLLHSCCGPCATAAAERLREAFELTLLFDNPNLDSAGEYERRARALEEAAGQMSLPVLRVPWEPEAFRAAAGALAAEPEGGRRCAACIGLRLSRAARLAAEGGFAYFASTLSVGPRKDAALINRLGEGAARGMGVSWLPADFKKRGGFQRSVFLSRQWGLYRQDYCGCVFSRRSPSPKEG